jgi:hypothetical protein
MVPSTIGKTCGIVLAVLGCSISVSAANAGPPVNDCDSTIQTSEASAPNDYVQGDRIYQCIAESQKPAPSSKKADERERHDANHEGTFGSRRDAGTRRR